MFDLVKKENLIFAILQEFMKHGLFFVIVGGYAVSAYKHRFSVDADIILKKGDLEKFDEILKKNKFVKSLYKKLEHVYASEYFRYETKEKPAASVDLLVNGIGSRTTNASFSIEQIGKYSKLRKITGIEKEIELIVPEKEILIALKIHAGRLTDFRDIAAMCKNIDIELVRNFINIGDKKVIINNIKMLLSLIEKKEFIDSFKGVFQEKKYDIDINEIKKLKQLL